LAFFSAGDASSPSPRPCFHCLYAGGHGWRGAVYPRIAAAIQWLEENAQAKPPAGDK
jgi:hypothetical protein